ncbi:histone H3.v1-like [Parambassis ranga]|uniref:Histone H3.v1-like n=1 Tax=Parambassis ranga TaxID=210632 RepID=A0A6P7HYK2_9TELE|nr:histone H3.v1-like [Parambassis ranga]XP_028255626.1 histone H3.v1-like [Parambassis ranga]XP_028255627.1 histone H3.v1-like [Parambassis ranga]XP_028255628.1 histone H3.v1-like [Parambassis ranga]
MMDPDREEDEVLTDTEDPVPLRTDEEEEQEEEQEEGEEDDEEEDARIFNAWMQQYRSGEQQKKDGEQGEEAQEPEAERPASRISLEPPTHMRARRRASLPSPAALSAMQLSRLHSSTQAPVTARVLLRRSSSRRLLPSPQEATAPTLERRPSLIPTIPEAAPPERRAQFRRRNVMSLSDAYSTCLICHNDLNQGSGGTRELQCTHTFHKECIEEWLWRKQSCPTCHVHVSIPQPVYWSSTHVKVP